MASSVWGRIVNAWGAAVSAFNDKALVPRPEYAYDSYAGRLARYYHLDSYANNTQYSTLVGYAATYKNLHGLYKDIRGIVNPYECMVDLYVALCAGGMVDLKNLRKGAVPLAEADDRERAGIIQLLNWSNWATKKSVYVRHGAKYGDVALKLCDDRVEQQVRLEVLNPAIVKHVELDGAGNVTFVIIEYQMAEDARPRPGQNVTQTRAYTYTEQIDTEWFRTFRDGQPYAFYKDADGYPIKEWPNEYGFVPLVTVKHKDVGLTWGASVCQGGQLRKIDEINDAVSLLNDNIRKAVNVLWYLAGAQAGDLVASTDKKDAFVGIYGPKDSQPHPLVAPIDIAAAGKNIQDLIANFERENPELKLRRVHEQTNLTAPGVEAGFQDGISKIVEARANYDDGLIRAFKMGLAIGGMNGYRTMEGFSLASRDGMEFTMADRPVMRDNISRIDRLNLLQQSKAPNRAIWEELDIPEQTIRQWEQERGQQRVIDAQAEAARLALSSGQEDDEGEQ